MGKAPARKYRSSLAATYFVLRPYPERACYINAFKLGIVCKLVFLAFVYTQRKYNAVYILALVKLAL